MGQIKRFDGHIEPAGCKLLLYVGSPHQVVLTRQLKNKICSMLWFYRNVLSPALATFARIFKYQYIQGLLVTCFMDCLYFPQVRRKNTQTLLACLTSEAFVNHDEILCAFNPRKAFQHNLSTNNPHLISQFLVPG